MRSPAPLTADEWKRIVKAFQKRHLIANKMGIVDDGYLKPTGTQARYWAAIRIDNGEAQELNRFLMLVGETPELAVREVGTGVLLRKSWLDVRDDFRNWLLTPEADGAWL